MFIQKLYNADIIFCNFPIIYFFLFATDYLKNTIIKQTKTLITELYATKNYVSISLCCF